jgi:hypothetical protein
MMDKRRDVGVNVISRSDSYCNTLSAAQLNSCEDVFKHALPIVPGAGGGGGGGAQDSDI